MHFFKFKLNSNIEWSLLFYTLLTNWKKNFIKKSIIQKNQIKINFKHKKLNYEKWVVIIVMNFQSYIFKNWNIIDFKNKKLNYDEKNQKNQKK